MSSLASSYDCMSDSSDNSAATVHIPGAGVFARERDKENHFTGEINSQLDTVGGFFTTTPF